MQSVSRIERQLVKLQARTAELEREVALRKAAQEALRESQLRLAGLVDSAMDAIINIDESHKIVLFNPAAEKMFGHRAKDLIGKPLDRLIPERFRRAHAAHTRDFDLAGVTNRKMGALGAISGVRANGEEFPIEASISQVKAGGRKFLTVILRDITERRQAEEGLLFSEARYRRLFEAAKDGILILNAETGQIEDVNPFLIEMLGYSHADFLGKELWQIGLFKDIVSNKEAFEKLQAEKYIRYDNLPLKTRDGRAIRVEFVSNAYDVEGRQVVQCNIRDITERQHADIVSKRLAAIVEFSDDAIIGKDLAGIITTWNQGAQKIFGYAASEMVGRSIMPLIPADRLKEEENILERIKLGKTMEHFETLRRTKDGRFIDVSITISPIKDAAGNVIGASKVARDITERKRAVEKLITASKDISAFRDLQRQLEKANRNLRDASAAKDRFLSTMSHELRTPLNAILGFTGTLLMGLPGPLTAEQKRQLETVRNSARHQLSLINDLLDLAKIESGKVSLKPELVACDRLLAELIETLRPLAAKKGLDLRMSLRGDNAEASTDRRALSQIVINLVNNAIKFTEKGRVDVDLRANSKLEIAVTDTGPGIRPEDQGRLFAPFSRIERSGAQATEGTGLGLHLSQKLAALLGATISFESELGKGTSFTLILPRNATIGD